MLAKDTNMTRETVIRCYVYRYQILGFLFAAAVLL